jgi:hypothetical protein
MLEACVERCPEAAWDAPVGSLAFCQVAFHTLFFTDYYLGRDDVSFRQQAYHREHADVFRDYEELESRPQKLLYERAAIVDYLAHCRHKFAEMLARETAESLAGPCGIARRRPMSQAELYLVNVRHMQHHAAQLSLRLRLDWQIEIPWVGSGGRELD